MLCSTMDGSTAVTVEPLDNDGRRGGDERRHRIVASHYLFFSGRRRKHSVLRNMVTVFRCWSSVQYRRKVRARRSPDLHRQHPTPKDVGMVNTSHGSGSKLQYNYYNTIIIVIQNNLFAYSVPGSHKIR